MLLILLSKQGKEKVFIMLNCNLKFYLGIDTKKYVIDENIEINIKYSTKTRNAAISIYSYDRFHKNKIYENVLFNVSDFKINRKISKAINEYYFDFVDDFAIIPKFNSDDFTFDYRFINWDEKENDEVLCKTLQNTIKVI